MSTPREHFSEGISRARVGLEVRRGAGPGVRLLVFLVLAALAAAWIVSNVSTTTFAKTRTVHFAVADATGVVPGRHEIAFRGIKAGTITDVRDEDGTVILTAKLKKEFGPLYRDARAALRPATPLQDMRLNVLDRGTRQAGELAGDAVLPAQRTSVAVQVGDVLNGLGPDVRTSLRGTLRDLGRGLDDRGEALGLAFERLLPLLAVARRTTAELATRRQATRRLVTNTGVLLDELGDRDEDLERFVSATGAAVDAIDGRSPQLRATVAALPGVLDQATSSLATVRGVLPEVDGGVAALRPVARRLPAALRDVRELSDTAAPAVRALRPAVRRLGPLATALPPVTRDLASAFRALRPQVGAIDHIVQSIAGCGRGLQGFFQYDASIGKFSDSRGLAPRGNFQFGLSDGGTVADPRMFAPENCVRSRPIGGRPAREEDHR